MHEGRSDEDSAPLASVPRDLGGAVFVPRPSGLLAGGPVPVAVQVRAVARVTAAHRCRAGGAGRVAVLEPARCRPAGAGRRDGAAVVGSERWWSTSSGAPESAGSGWSGQVASTRAMASRSGAVTDNPNFAFTAICRATYAHR